MSRRPTMLYQDAAWIIALWHALHGDQATKDVAAEVIAGLSRYLPGSEPSFLSWELQSPHALGASSEHLEPLAVETELEALGPDQREHSIHHYYYEFKGHWYCLDLPALTHSPTAA